MTERKPRKDAARNRAALLDAADTLFAQCDDPRRVTMADIAAAANVGKGTLFRAFGDRTGLIHTLYIARLEPIRHAAETGPPPLGPTTPPRERIPALLDALLSFKLGHRHLALALEESGSTSPYQAAHYERWHSTLQATLERIPGLTGCDFTAHALLAATRADLIEHLTGHVGMSGEQIRARLSDHTAKLLAETQDRTAGGPDGIDSPGRAGRIR